MFFHSTLPVSTIRNGNLDGILSDFNDAVYNYFRDNCGTVENSDQLDKEFKQKYRDFSKNQLKKELRTLKKENACDEKLIKYVSKPLRSKITDSRNKNIYSIDHDLEVKNKFLNYTKIFI